MEVEEDIGGAGDFGETENVGVNLLEDLDSYLKDIDDRLTVSRMVSDSVIKGMVKAVEKMAEEKIAAKESEVVRLREATSFLLLGDGKIDGNGLNHRFPDVLMERGKVYSSCHLASVARGQIEKLRKERAVCPGVEDELVDKLEMAVDTMFTKVNNMVELSKESICRCWQEQEFQRDIEDSIIQVTIRCFCEEIEEKFWDRNVRLEWINEVSDVRKKLDLLLKSLPNSESGELISHDDHFHRKLLTNHVSTSSSLWVENGQSEESKNGVPEYTVTQLGHLTKEGLVNHFNSIITKMRRNHELEVQEMTEDYYALKREYLKEKGSALPLRKDKDMDQVRKKIPEVILKLDDILVENEKLFASGEEVDSFRCLKDRVNRLLWENHQLRESLSEKKKEVKNMNLQISDVNEKISQHSLAEEKFMKLVDDWKSAADDADIKVLVIDEVYRCVLKEMAFHKDSNVKGLEKQSPSVKKVDDFSCSEDSQDAKDMIKLEIGDSEVESMIRQEFCGVILGEVIKDAKAIVDDLTIRHLHESESRLYLEFRALEREKELKLLFEEKDRLKQEIGLVKEMLEEKEQLGLNLSAALAKERDQFELVSHEINMLRDQTCQLKTSLNERDKELDLARGELAESLRQGELLKVDMNKVNKELELMSEKLREADKQRDELHAAVQKKQNDLVLFESRDNEQRKQMQSVIVFAQGLLNAFSEFECRVEEDIRLKTLRLEDFSSLLQSFCKKTNILKRTASAYKQRLERRCTDLQTAEAEVDLLGDQVDTLLNLLEKIYIALDHYSPILQHYPGVIEILKLVRRELRGESVKFK